MIDAKFGGGVIKPRLPRQGQGRFAGYRMIVLYRTGSMTVLVDVFGKGDQHNIETDDLKLLRGLAV